MELQFQLPVFQELVQQYELTEVDGSTKVSGDSEVKGEVKSPKATIDNIEAKSSLKSPNISDGIAIK